MEQVQHGEEAGIESEARVWSLHHQVRSPLMASVETPWEYEDDSSWLTAFRALCSSVVQGASQPAFVLLLVLCFFHPRHGLHLGDARIAENSHNTLRSLATDRCYDETRDGAGLLVLQS